MRIRLTLLFFFSFWVISKAQQNPADSLMNLIAKGQADTNKVNHLNGLAVALWGNLDTAIICSNSALELAKKLNTGNDETGWLKGIGRSNYLLGVFYFDKGDFITALSYNKEALGVWETLEKKVKDAELNQVKIFKAKSMGEIGNAYWGMGNYPKALEFQLKCLKINEELKHERGVGSTQGNIGNIYQGQKNYEKALEYYLKSLKVSRKFGKKYDISIDLRNIGNVYRYMNNTDKSLEYLMMALVVSKELGNDLETANNLSSIGALLQTQADSLLSLGTSYSQLKEKYDKAMSYYLQSLKLDQEIGNDYGIALNLLNIAGVFAKEGRYQESEKYFLQALAMDSLIGSLHLTKSLHEGLTEVYEAKGDDKKALHHYKLLTAVKDSLFSEDKNKEITRHELNYEFEKKESILKAEQEKKEAVAVSEQKRQKIFFWLVSSVAIAVALIALIVMRSLRITRKQKLIIEHQKDLVEEKQREVMDSIHYARRIQRSLLPTERYIQRNIDRLKERRPE